jgi:hypothetical protein
MKNKILVGAMLIVPMISFAANNFDEEVNAELDKMYQQTKTKNVAPAPAAAVQVNVSQGQDQNQNQNQAQAQKQPTTIIEASPLTESRADRIRKARQDVEVQTEQKIVEKLELSRIEDERRRGEVLFGDRFNQLNAQQQQTLAPAPAPIVVMAPPPPAPAPAPVAVAPAPVQEVAAPAPSREDKLDKEAVRAEISAALADLKEKEEKPKDKMYMSGLLGTSDYPDAKNLKGQYAAGFSIGKTFANQMQIEGSFIYSSYQVEQMCGYYNPCGGYVYGQYYPTITQMDQYQGSVVGKYQMFTGMFRPVLGAAMAYTYRSFTDTQFARYNSDATSKALDVGFVTGADLVVSDSFTLGIDFRYFTNVTNQSSSSFQNSFVFPNGVSGKPVEKLNYYTLGIVGRTSF